jgi:hypothetical protein
MQIETHTFPYAILINALDECNGELHTASSVTHANVYDRRRAQDQQEELLTAIKHCILDNDLLFRVFIASWPEWVIHTALELNLVVVCVSWHTTSDSVTSTTLRRI